jgi:endonuclease YncB( thermonuclease family)
MSFPLLSGLARLLLCAFGALHSALAEIAGRATVIDGGTIAIRGEPIRLEVIDVPAREGCQLFDIGVIRAFEPPAPAPLPCTSPINPFPTRQA